MNGNKVNIMLLESEIEKWRDYLLWKSQVECKKNEGDAECNRRIATGNCPNYCSDGVCLMLVLQGRTIPDEKEMDEFLNHVKGQKK